MGSRYAHTLPGGAGKGKAAGQGAPSLVLAASPFTSTCQSGSWADPQLHHQLPTPNLPSDWGDLAESSLGLGQAGLALASLCWFLAPSTPHFHGAN